MQTIIFDLDGTLTDIHPLEDPLLRAKNPAPKLCAYKAVDFIKQNAGRYRFVYATGATQANAEYVLHNLGLWELFDTAHSVSATTCPQPKATGAPFKQIAQDFPDCIVVGDSQADATGAQQAGLPCVLLPTNQALTKAMLTGAVFGQG